jgi:hypothetical protein
MCALSTENDAYVESASQDAFAIHLVAGGRGR